VKRRLPHVSATRVARLRRVFAIAQRVSPALAARLAFFLFFRVPRRKLDASDAPTIATARKHRITQAGGELQVYEWGEAPRTVVILHGWGSHAPRFAPLVHSLVEGSWRVLALDAPGHGQSSGNRSSLPQFRSAVEAVMQRFGPVQALIGHSLGALAVAIKLGEDASAGIAVPAAAVLISTPRDAAFLVESFRQMFGINESTASLFQALFDKRFHRRPEDFDALREAQHIDLRVLLIHDRNDEIVPFAHSEALHRHIRRSVLHATRGLGHSGLLRDRETILTIRGFLNDLQTDALPPMQTSGHVFAK
jgi:pimeloyl-ACP methyl ester carboxylesterase